MEPDISQNTDFEVKIMIPKTSVDEIIELSFLSGPSDEMHYKKIMLGFIANSLSAAPDHDLGIIYGLYKGEDLIASARIKQDEYTAPAVSIEYVAVKSEYRGQHLGEKFMQGIFKEIKELWNKKYAILATGESKGFYEKIGMQVLGELPGMQYPRYYMYKKLD